MASTQMTARTLREAGEAIRRERMNRGLSPEQLGYEAKVSGRTVRRIEDGARPTVRVMFQLAKVLDCKVVDLWPL
jgi:ribosome-binding protein aMBF1 (putative translation factor)